MEHQQPLSEEGTPRNEQQVEQEQRYKTLGVRLNEELHAQLSFIAQLSDTSLAEEIRRSIEARVSAAQDDPDLIARAEAVRAQIEREAEARRSAISGFFGKLAVEAAATTSEASVARSRAGRRTSHPKGAEQS
jgi:hypothetical protein